jgi:DNA-damage-inducible protein J
MAETTNLNIRIDRDLKVEADAILNKMGMNLSTAVNVFVRQIVQERAIPFKIYLDEELTKAELLRRIKNLEAGKGVFLTDEEFERQSEDE